VFLESLFTRCETTWHYDIMITVLIAKPVKTVVPACATWLHDQKWYILQADCVYVRRVIRKKVLLFPHTELADWFRGASAKLRQTASCLVMTASPSIRPFPWNNSTPTIQILMEYDICALFENM
jgi:hypothetical protein